MTPKVKKQYKKIEELVALANDGYKFKAFSPVHNIPYSNEEFINSKEIRDFDKKIFSWRQIILPWEYVEETPELVRFNSLRDVVRLANLGKSFEAYLVDSSRGPATDHHFRSPNTRYDQDEVVGVWDVRMVLKTTKRSVVIEFDSNGNFIKNPDFSFVQKPNSKWLVTHEEITDEKGR